MMETNTSTRATETSTVMSAEDMEELMAFRAKEKEKAAHERYVAEAREAEAREEERQVARQADRQATAETNYAHQVDRTRRAFKRAATTGLVVGVVVGVMAGAIVLNSDILKRS